MSRIANLSLEPIHPCHEKAIDVLQKLQNELGASALAYFITPNTILTLSGARAFCDNGFNSNDSKQLTAWSHEINRGLAALSKNEDVPYTRSDIHETPRGQKVAAYSLIYRPGLFYSLSQTKLLTDDYIPYSQARLTGKALMQNLKKDLSHNPELSNFKDAEIDAVGLGILLGYPDKAIVSGMKLWAEERDDELVDAKISDANFYDCAQPVYSYSSDLANDPQIIAHEKMWSEILNKFYQSDFHKQLAADKNFQRKIHELSLIR